MGEFVGGGLQRWHAEVAFDLATQGFEVMVSDSRGQPVRIAAEVGQAGAVSDHKEGQLEAWDLHVGVHVRMLGRVVALKQVESLTGKFCNGFGSPLYW